MTVNPDTNRAKLSQHCSTDHLTPGPGQNPYPAQFYFVFFFCEVWCKDMLKTKRDWCQMLLHQRLIHTCFKNLGLTWMLALTVGGSGLMGQAGSTELTRTSSAYSFFSGNTSSHVERNLNRLFLVFSSTYKQRTWLGPHELLQHHSWKYWMSTCQTRTLLAGLCYDMKYTGAECRRSHRKASNKQEGRGQRNVERQQRELYLFKDTYKWSD